MKKNSLQQEPRIRKIVKGKAEELSKEWFEMQDFPVMVISNKVWVPLRIIEKVGKGRYGYEDYSETFFGLGSVAIPVTNKDDAMKLNWEDVGISHSHSGYYDDNDNMYVPADTYRHFPGDLQGIHLVLEIPGNSLEKMQWEPHQDIIVTLGLIREGDVWFSPDDGYVEVIRLLKDEEGSPSRIEIRADHLTDYLCARDMGLLATYYTSRQSCFSKDQKMDWEKDGTTPQQKQNGKWEGREWAIHEGGSPYGEKWAVFHVARTDPVESEDIPEISVPASDENTVSESWKKGFKGKKLYKVMGELWRTEWLDPATVSRRVKGDKVPSTSYFAVDEKGTKVNGNELIDNGKWLWFRPEVIPSLVDRRGGALKWYTRDTGEVSALPYHGVHFGVNDLGLVNVFANDIGLLPDWHQQIWAGYNISPDGGVSTELLASQVHATPADTQPPEPFLARGIQLTNYLSQQIFGIDIFSSHEAVPDILIRIHRFRAHDRSGFFALAKDLARVTADSINTAGIQSVVPPPKDKKLGSLKSLELLIATKVGEKKAKAIMAPLFNVYGLRMGDAHLPSEDIEKVFISLKIDKDKPFIQQGFHMIEGVVSSIYLIIRVLKDWEKIE
jgi:hypothetical protein